MRKFRFVGTIRDAKGYGEDGQPIPEIGKVYNEDDIFCENTVLTWSEDKFLDIFKEWEEVFNQELDQIK